MSDHHHLHQALLSAHHELARNRLVVSSQGNASIRVNDTIFIKASGAQCHDMTANDIASAFIGEGDTTFTTRPLKPSTDFASHRYIYRYSYMINAIVHTHSTYATAFAAQGFSIPCILTAQADEFGGLIPCAPLVPIGGEEIGKAAVENLFLCGPSIRPICPAVLMRNHGVFTLGIDYDPQKALQKAIKAAIMVEDCAKTTFMAMQFGSITPLPSVTIDACYKRYHETYGQDQ